VDLAVVLVAHLILLLLPLVEHTLELVAVQAVMVVARLAVALAVMQALVALVLVD
jgi:hypothetical protein